MLFEIEGLILGLSEGLYEGDKEGEILIEIDGEILRL